MDYVKKGTVFLASMAIVVAVVAWANSDFTVSDGTPSPTGVTLDDIYNKLSNNTTTSKSFSPDREPTQASYHDLGEIYSLLTPISSSTITTGSTIMGVSGSYNISNLTPDKVATGTHYGTSSVGTMQ